MRYNCRTECHNYLTTNVVWEPKFECETMPYNWNVWKFAVKPFLLPIRISKVTLMRARMRKKKSIIERSCPESNRGYSEFPRKVSEPNVMTTTLHNHFQKKDMWFDIIYLISFSLRIGLNPFQMSCQDS